MTEPNPNVQHQVPRQPEVSGIAPQIVEGWSFSQQLDSPLSAKNPDPQATLNTIRDLRKKYGDDNFMIGPGYSDDGGQDSSRTSIYLREGAKPRGLARRIGASIFGRR